MRRTIYQEINTFIESISDLWKDEPLNGDETEDIIQEVKEELEKQNGEYTDGKFYPITSIHKDDLRGLFRDDEKALKKIDVLDDSEMKWLASKMADQFCDCCYWEALKCRFKGMLKEDESSSGGVK